MQLTHCLLFVKLSNFLEPLARHTCKHHWLHIGEGEMRPFRLACAYIVHDDHWYLEQSIRSFSGHWPTFVFLSTHPWSGEIGDYALAREAALRAGAQVIEGV